MTEERGSLEPYIRDDVQFYRHQIEGIRDLARRRSFILADDMGLGKSLEALTVFGIDVFMGWSKTAIIIAPPILKRNWADEIEKFTRFQYVLLNGGPSERTRQLADFMMLDSPKILITNYEQIISHLDALNALSFDVAIFDEAHYLKNPKAKRTKACLDLYSRRSFMLTGTPMLNHVNELWALLHRVDPDAWPKYWTYVSRYCVYGGFKDKQIVGTKNQGELTSKVQAVMLRRLKKDVLDLPEVQIIERRVDLAPEQRKLYDSIIEDLRVPRIGQANPDVIENALVKFLRLKQVCGSMYPFTGEDISAKMDLAEADDLAILDAGHRIVVWTQFRDIQSVYAARLSRYGLPVFQLHGDVPQAERSAVVKNWGLTKEPGVIVCMIQVAGLGLTMTQSRHASFLDKAFVPGVNQQAIDRQNRIGADTTQAIQVREYIARNTIDSRIASILKTKTGLINTTIEAGPDWKRLLVQAIMEKEGD